MTDTSDAVPRHIWRGARRIKLRAAIWLSRDNAHKKYLADPKEQIPRAWRRATELKLHVSPPLDILEIGVGAGYFLYVCKQLGHRVLGIDRPSLQLWPRVWSCLGISEIINEPVRPLTPLPVSGKRFDLVVSFHCPLHFVDTEDRFWNQDEWQHFFGHLRSDVLKAGGRFALDLKKKTKGGLQPAYVPNANELSGQSEVQA